MEEKARIPVTPPISNPLPSYWQEPKSPLAYTNSLDSGNAETIYDYAIIGSGISGTMIAYNLLYANHSSTSAPSPNIVMLEARDLCGGATGRNGGHTKAASYRTYLQHRDLYGKNEALKIARLEYANIIATHKLAADLGIECDNQRCNTVDIIYDQETFEAGKKAIEAIREDAEDEEKKTGGMAWYRVYEKNDGVAQKFWVGDKNNNPAVKTSEKVVGAIEYIAGRINAYKFTTGVLEKCVQKGLKIATHTPIHSINPVTTSTNDNNNNTTIHEISTPTLKIKTRTLILATNGYTPFLLNSLQAAIVPLRGQITTQQSSPRIVHPSILPRTYSFIYASGYEYMVSRNEPDGTQHIIIGGGLGRLPQGGASEFGTVNDGELNPEISTYLKGTLSGYFGGRREEGEGEGEAYTIVSEWTGIMGATADGLPFVGEVPGPKGVWVCAGFNGHGMVLCLKSAEAVVGMVRDGERGEWFPESFLVSRERLDRCVFKGRMDMVVPETKGEGLLGL